MAEVRVQVAFHFKIDPARQNIGLIEYPDTVMKTVSVGEEVVPSKLSFIEAFTGDDKAIIEEKLMALVEESLCTARPTEKKPVDKATTGTSSSCSGTGNTGKSNPGSCDSSCEKMESAEMSLF